MGILSRATAALVLIVLAAACGRGGADGEGLYVMVPSFPAVQGEVFSVTGAVAYGAGADPRPELARATRCVLRRDSVVGQLQFSGEPPPIGVQLAFTDRADGEVHRSERPALAATPRVGPDGRPAFTVAIPVEGLDPDAQERADYRWTDCVMTVWSQPPGVDGPGG